MTVGEITNRSTGKIVSFFDFVMKSSLPLEQMNSFVGSPRREKLRAAISMDPQFIPWVLPKHHLWALKQHLALSDEVLGPDLLNDNDEAFESIEVLITGWNALELNEGTLCALPNLKIVLHAAGTVRGLVTDAFWNRDILLTSASAANARPTACFAEAAITLGLKHAWHYFSCRDLLEATYADTPNSGIYGGTVGLVGLSRVGRLVAEMLRPKGVRILAYDPVISPAEAESLEVSLVTLQELFAQADVVSLHAPLLPETEGMISGELIGGMKSHATLVNTARGAIVREGELESVLASRRDLSAVLDVTEPEPTPLDSPLRRLPNVFLTPHIAGSRHRECERLGAMVLEELEHYLRGEPLHWRVTRESVRVTA